jgi:tetratricopeptide (TPR) repeat protein
LNLILAYDLVLLYARSGTGKTSLLNAGILEELRAREFFPATVRLNSEAPIDNARKAILAEAARVGLQVEQVDETSQNLVLLLSKARFWHGDILLTPVIILDQFEELFTLHEHPVQGGIIEALSDLAARRLPDEIEGKTEQISTVPYKLVFSIREDYLGEMESVAARIPTIMHHRFRLTPLSQEQARKAIREPAAMENKELRGPAFTYSDEAIDELVSFLSRRRERQGYRQVDDVEPFQLQIICQHIEDEVSKRSAEAGPIVISRKELGGHEGMDQMLEQFYNDQIGQLPQESRELAHRLCENGLISPTGKRISLEEDYIASQFGVDPLTLKKLVELRLLRAEPRVGSTYYELSHDTLVAAVERTGAERMPAILLEQARFSWEDRNYRMAFRYYIDLINLSPKDRIAYVECATMLMAIGRYEDADKVLEAAVNVGLSDENLHMALGQLRLYQGRGKDAIGEFEQVLKHNAHSARGYFGMGEAYLNGENNPRAADSFSMAVELDPNMQDAHIGLLQAMINMRQFDRVEDHVARIRQKEFFNKLLPALTKELVRVGASMIARKILGDALPDAEDTYDAVETIAYAAFSINEWEIAEAALEAASRINPEAPIYGTRGIVLQNLNRFNEAEAMYSEALQRNPRDIESLLNRALTRTILKHYDDAIDDCRRAVYLEAGSPRPFNYWGRCLSGQGKHQEAIEKFEEADRLKPGDSELLALWAGSLNDLGLYDKAMEKAREASKADQTNADAFYELGRSLWFTDRLTEANDRFQTAYELDRSSADILSSWGVLLSVMQRHDDAIEKFERANYLDPENAYTLRNWGKSLGDSGRYQASVDRCRQALKLEPENADTHLSLARSLDALGDVDEALNHFREAARLAPNDVWTHVSWANALIKQAKYAEAEEQYRQAIQRATGDELLIAVYDSWGTSLGRRGLHQEAEEMYRKALEIKTDILLLASIALQLAYQGRLDEARKLCLQAERMGPKDESELGELGWVFYQLGDYDKSLHYSRRALEFQPRHNDFQWR